MSGLRLKLSVILIPIKIIDQITGLFYHKGNATASRYNPFSTSINSWVPQRTRHLRYLKKSCPF